MTMTKPAAVAGADRGAGVMLVGAAVLGLITIWHHPHDFKSEAILKLTHGLLILLMTCITIGLIYFARQRGPGRLTTLVAAVALMTGLFGNLGAALVNGFVVPTLVAGQSITPDVLRFAWELNQTLGSLGVVGSGIGYILLGLDLVLRCDGVSRLTGAIAAAIGTVSATLVVTGSLELDLWGAIVAYGMQIVAAALFGILLLRGKVAP